MRSKRSIGKAAIVAVDIGNTSTTIGLCTGSRITKVLRVPTHLQKPVPAITSLLRGCMRKHGIEAVVLCSVVPARNRIWRECCRALKLPAPMVIRHSLNLGITIRYPQPQRIGADRLANACAAVRRYGYPVIVADFGTALTFDVVSQRGEYIGGVIAPGLPLMTNYLAERTALLPSISIKGRTPPVGRCTEDAMRTGAVIGYRGMVREILSYIQSAYPSIAFTVVATGGYAQRALRNIQLPIRLQPTLTLEGIVQIYARNKKGS